MTAHDEFALLRVRPCSVAATGHPRTIRGQGQTGLYRVTDGATVAQIAADLGIAHGSLSAWLRAAGVAIRRRGHTAAPPGPVETPEQEATRLRARVQELEAESVKLNTERDILRAAAKYFAGETNW